MSKPHRDGPKAAARTEFQGSGKIVIEPIVSVKPQDTEVTLQYLAKDSLYDHIKPLQVTPNFASTAHLSNVRLTPGPSEVLHDVRDHFADLSLDTHGFQYVHAPTGFSTWTSQSDLTSSYLPELEHVLRDNVSGCDEILFYDLRTRHALPLGSRTAEGLSSNPFARQVHTDNTPSSALEKIQQLTDMKAEFLLRGRCRLINLWRPIKHPVYDCGLAVASGASLREGDVRECERRRADTGAYWDTMGVVQYRPGFEWFYLSNHSPDDVILFKNYDSDDSVAAKICLHTAFDLPLESIPPNAPQRESIEVRALVFTFPPSSLSITRPSLPLLPFSKPNLKLDAGYEPDQVVSSSHSLALRNDIDEGSEIKDAELLLRKRRIRDLEQTVRELARERGALKAQCAVQAGRIGELETLADTAGAAPEWIEL
ncbi:hypothetical protein B0A48_02059 [Cryoendolithus antarcticus]|uniref:Uncharacterized protein n=1 Tax=Cryoendolithus antarcticus TaxID=1507870 RepID=A0A1V8TMI9_9PEZI|nr:hypothetical protein B0A48_02059 [Cryoendolithus antarcticus]